jgi:antitoxin component of RelBE/YafQ-DinJ toxin-antitoxin module
MASQALMTMIQEISILDSLYEQAANLTQEMQIPPSDLFSLALEKYLHRHYNQKLVQSINDAYADGLDQSEQAMLEGMRRHQRQLWRTNDLSGRFLLD